MHLGCSLQSGKAARLESYLMNLHEERAMRHQLWHFPAHHSIATAASGIKDSSDQILCPLMPSQSGAEIIPQSICMGHAADSQKVPMRVVSLQMGCFSPSLPFSDMGSLQVYTHGACIEYKETFVDVTQSCQFNPMLAKRQKSG